MTRQVRFQCPHCGTAFPMLVNTDHFSCLRCARTFAVIYLGKGERGWVDDPVIGWAQAVSQEIHPLSSLPKIRSARPEFVPDLSGLGAARLRREQRRSRRRTAAFPIQMLALLLVGLALLSPIAIKGHSMQLLVANARDLAPVSGTQEPIPAALAVKSSPTASPTPAATTTPLPTSTPTSTATPLPRNLVVATLWQATVDQATIYSHATQTQAMGNYEATQTALPYKQTAMAQERQATATQKAALATARASAHP